MADQAFVVYRMVTQAVAATPRIVPLRHFTHDLEAMAEAVTSRTRMVFVANPNNPTGTIFRRGAWEAFLRMLSGKPLLVVADDAYAEFATDSEYPDTIACRGAGDVPVVSLRTFSKLYGLAGLRVGYAVAPTGVIDALGRVRQPFNVNALALVAADAALDDRAHVEKTLAVNREGMAYLTREFDRLGLPWVPSNANFVLVRVGRGVDVYEALLRQGVIVRPMDGYGFPDHLRVSVGLPDENGRAIRALETVLGAARR
jgi:histidinol-phosphate aminotransferase